MECLVVLALFALALVGPVLLGRWAEGSRTGWVLLILTTIAAGVLACIRFGKVSEITGRAGLRKVYALTSEPGALQVLQISPLTGFDGVQISLGRKDAQKIRESDMGDIQWTCPSAHVDRFSESDGSEAEEMWLLDTGHQILERPIELQLVASEESWHLLDALELRVRPNGCCQSDLAVLRYIHATFGALFSTWTLMGSFVAIRSGLRRRKTSRELLLPSAPR